MKSKPTNRIVITGRSLLLPLLLLSALAASIPANNVRALVSPTSPLSRDFGISASPGLLTIQPGLSKISTITLTSLGGFTGSVSLATKAPEGFTTVFGLNPVPLTSGSSDRSNLTVSVSSSVSPTSVTLTVNATSGLLFHQTTIMIMVASQDFNVSANPSSLRIETGSHRSSNVTLTSQNGFTGSVLLAASAPAGVTLKFAMNPLQLSPGASSVSNLTIYVASTVVPTTVPIIVNATSGLLLHQTTIVITISVPMPPTLFISPAKISPAALGSSINLNVSVASMPTFNAWDILVKTDPTIINATSISLTNSMLAGGSSLVSCINNVGTSCNPAAGDGMGVAHSAVVGFGSRASGSGVLFTITYRVVGDVITGSGSPIVIFNDHLSTPIGSDILHVTSNGVYGTQPSLPDFELIAGSTSLTVVQGSSNMTALSLTSLNGFAGIVNLTLAISPTIHAGLTASLTKPNVTLTLASSGSSTLKISATSLTQASTYTVAVTGSSGSISHQVSISVELDLQPFFEVSASPSLLMVHAGQFGNSILTLTSKYGFSGNIILTVASPQGVDTTLNETTLRLGAGRQVEAAVTISVPLSRFAFIYRINVTATSGSLSPVVSQINVQPPPATFSTNVGSGSIDVEAGRSANSTIIISSVDYLYGFVYISAEMSGGAASLSTTRVFLLPNGTANSTATVTIGANTVPGHYLLLLTIYQLGSQTNGVPSQTTSVPVTILVTGIAHARSLSSPNLILGLSPPVYFGILGVLAAILGALSVQTYRKSKED